MELLSLFQSTHPRGVRLVRPFSSLQYFRVSIHAPAWGATLYSTVPAVIDSCFNPRTRVGCDARKSRRNDLRDVFQSTHPRGVRRTACRALL